MISIKIPELEDGFLDEEAKSYIPEKFRDLYEFALIINRRIYKSYN